jgi:hypothetical protein
MKTQKMRRLQAWLDDELNSYVAAAKATASANRRFVAAAISAITLGSVSLAPPLLAEIIYTPANKSIGKSNGASWMPIDLNNDGIVDLSISAYNFTSFSSGWHLFGDLGAFGVEGNQILVEGNYLAVPAVTAQVIGPVSARVRFQQDGLMAEHRDSGNGFSTYHSTKGLWLHATNRYLGVRFSINGETHYGWARFNAGAGYAQLTGYAYETIPDKPIPAGVFETAPPESGANSTEGANAGSLGALALGAARR